MAVEEGVTRLSVLTLEPCTKVGDEGTVPETRELGFQREVNIPWAMEYPVRQTSMSGGTSNHMSSKLPFDVCVNRQKYVIRKLSILTSRHNDRNFFRAADSLAPRPRNPIITHERPMSFSLQSLASPSQLKPS